jgi:hypothetical protein
VGSSDAELSIIKLEKFHQVIGKDLEDVFEKNKHSHEVIFL